MIIDNYVDEVNCMKMKWLLQRKSNKETTSAFFSPSGKSPSQRNVCGRSQLQVENRLRCKIESQLANHDTIFFLQWWRYPSNMQITCKRVRERGRERDSAIPHPLPWLWPERLGGGGRGGGGGGRGGRPSQPASQPARAGEGDIAVTRSWQGGWEHWSR